MCSVYLACNFGTTTVAPLPYWEEGKTASHCKSGRHPKYPNLCKNEHYESIEEHMAATALAEAKAKGIVNPIVEVSVKTFHHWYCI